jgi:hypothetical protein
MVAHCHEAHRPHPELVTTSSATHSRGKRLAQTRQRCLGEASLYYSGVYGLACGAYKRAQLRHCTCRLTTHVESLQQQQQQQQQEEEGEGEEEEEEEEEEDEDSEWEDEEADWDGEDWLEEEFDDEDREEWEREVGEMLLEEEQDGEDDDDEWEEEEDEKPVAVEIV